MIFFLICFLPSVVVPIQITFPSECETRPSRGDIARGAIWCCGMSLIVPSNLLGYNKAKDDVFSSFSSDECLSHQNAHHNLCHRHIFVSSKYCIHPYVKWFAVFDIVEDSTVSVRTGTVSENTRSKKKLQFS